MKYAKVSLAPQGGMQDTPASIQAGLAVLLENAFYRFGSWVWRAGSSLMHATAYSDRLAGAWGLKSTGYGSPTFELIVATAGDATHQPTFLRKVGSSLVAIPYNGAIPPTTTDVLDNWRPWRGEVVTEDVLYACRRSYLGALAYHVTVNAVTSVGIPGPVAAPTVTNDATVSTLPGGIYPVAYRYVTSDGQSSPMSPATLSASITALQSRSWVVVASSHPRVTGIELFIGFPGGAAEVVYLATTVANVTGTYIEATLDSEYEEVSGNFGLTVPPSYPEDIRKWDGRLWYLTNFPRPLIYPSHIDEAGATLETVDPQEAVELPVGGGRRYMAIHPWDRGRQAALTDSSAHIIQPGAGTAYSVSDIDLDHGCVSASACAVAKGLLVWCDGRNILASDGGPAQIVSEGWLDEALSHIPSGYTDRIVVFYTPDDGGAFWIAFPSTSSSTNNDLAACWDGKNWHKRAWAGGEKAPLFLNRIPSSAAQWITVGAFLGDNRVMRLDRPVRRDVGPYNIAVRIITAEVPIPEGYATCCVARVHVGLRLRVDTNVPITEAVARTASVSLRLNSTTDTTPVSATVVGGTEYLHARAHNLGNPVESVSVILDFDIADTFEVFDVLAECVFYKRESGRT